MVSSSNPQTADKIDKLQQSAVEQDLSHFTGGSAQYISAFSRVSSMPNGAAFAPSTVVGQQKHGFDPMFTHPTH